MTLPTGDTISVPRRFFGQTSAFAIWAGFACVLFLVLGTNCPGLQITPCTTDVECDDADGCTLDGCVIDGDAVGVCNNTLRCVDAAHCLEGACVECLDSAECDDADTCDGVETCEPVGTCRPGLPPDCDDNDPCTVDLCNAIAGCSNTAVQCGPGEPCIDGMCYDPCDGDADCDDEDVCTTEACVDGACRGGPVDCDDGLFCTQDLCDPIAGCTHPPTCTGDWIVCNEITGACEDIEPCTSDADCPDDGLFCTGVESCDPDSGLCVSSGDPCFREECLHDGDPCDGSTCEFCDETLDECYVLMPDYGIEFTLGADRFMGTVCDDRFVANLAFNAPTGTNRPTLQTGDALDGREGADILGAVFNFSAATTVTPTLVSVETINVTDFGTAATTLEGAGISGATAFNFINSTNSNAFTVTNLTTLADLGLTSQGVGATLRFLPAATSGNADAVTLTVNKMIGGTATFATDATNGIEVVNVVSESNASVLTAIVVEGAALSALNITGDAALTFTGAVAATVLNAADFAATLTLSVTSTAAMSITGGTGNDTLYGSDQNDAISGGAGNDSILGQGGLDMITTGSGADHVRMVLTDAGDVITDFTPGTDKFDWNTALSSIDSSVTTPTAANTFQSAPAGAAIAATTTVFELTGTTVSTQTAANVVTALAATATNADTNANMLFVIYTSGGGGAIWNWINTDANVEASELTLITTFSTLTPDGLSASDFE